MKLPKQVRPEMLDRSVTSMRSQAVAQQQASGISPQGCGDAGVQCGPCSGGMKWCTEAGKHMPFQCSC